MTSVAKLRWYPSYLVHILIILWLTKEIGPIKVHALPFSIAGRM